MNICMTIEAIKQTLKGFEESKKHPLFVDVFVPVDAGYRVGVLQEDFVVCFKDRKDDPGTLTKELATVVANIAVNGGQQCSVVSFNDYADFHIKRLGTQLNALEGLL